MTAKPNDNKPRKSGAKSIPAKAGRSEKRGNVFLSGLKNFGIVFIICLVVFGLLATLAVSFVTSAVDDIFEEKTQLEDILNKDSSEASSTVDEEPLPNGESFTVFVAVTDYDPVHYNYYPYGEDLKDLRSHSSDNSMGILSAGYKSVSTKLNAVVRFDKERREYTVTPVSSHTRIFTPAGYLQLGELYHTFGPQFLVDKVEALTGFGIDYFMFVDAREVPRIVNALGPFNVEISKDIYSDGAAFGTLDRDYDDVTRVIAPDPIVPETKKAEKDKEKDADDTENETTEEITETEPVTEETPDSKTPDWIKGGRDQYHLVVNAGTVTVTAGNVRALLMFDDHMSGGVEERAELEFQLVRGALLRLASMNDADRVAFCDAYMSVTPIEECSVTFGNAKLVIDGDDKADEDEKDDGEDEDDKPSDPAGYGSLTDGFINTDFTHRSAMLKSELVAAAMRFPVKHLEYEGRYVNGFFSADITGNASRFMQYKLPPDPEKSVAAKS